MAIGGIDEAVVERWVLDADQYRGEIKSVASEIRKQAKAAADAALVQGELTKKMNDAARAAMTWKDRLGEAINAQYKSTGAGKDLIQSYKDISQGMRDAIQIGKKLNDWLSANSPEWKAMSDEMGRNVDEMGKAVAQSTLMQGVMGGVAKMVDLATVSVAAFTGSLEKVPYQKLADFMVLIGGAFGARGLTPDTMKAMLTPFVGAQQSAEARKRDQATSMVEWKEEEAWAALLADRSKVGRGRARRGGGGGIDVERFRPARGEGLELGGVDEERAALDLQLRKLQVADDLRRIREDETINQARQNAMQRESNRLVADAVAKQVALNEQAAGYDTALRGLADGGLAQFGAGIWSAIDAAVQGKATFGEAMASLARSVLMSIAAQATGEAVLETGRGLAALATTWGVPNTKATLHFAAAGVFAGIGATAGLAGVAVGAAMGGGAPSGSGGAGSSFRTSDRMGSASSFGERKRKEDLQPIIVEVYLGDKSNRAAAIQLEKQLAARIKREAA